MVEGAVEAEREARFAVIDLIRDAFKGVPDAELEREIPKAFEEARAQLRAEREQTAKPGLGSITSICATCGPVAAGHKTIQGPRLTDSIQLPRP